MSNVTMGSASAVVGPIGQSTDVEVFLRSLALVGVAELFDKTWFMGLLLALRYRASTVFVGSFAALFLHTILAAAMGYAFARLLSPLVLHCLTASVMGLFFVLYAKDWYGADPESDAIEAGKEEAQEDTMLTPEEPLLGTDAIVAEDAENPSTEESVDRAPDAMLSKFLSAEDAQELLVLGKSFMAVFIAEWGDRTQIAMIGQHASQPLIPVFLGSTVAFFLLTLSAVGAATALQGRKVSEKTIHGVSASFFLVFTILAARDAFTSWSAANGTE